MGFRNKKACGDLLSHWLPSSIIGEGELNFRVRNGVGCDLSSMAASKFSLLFEQKYMVKIESSLEDS